MRIRTKQNQRWRSIREQSKNRLESGSATIKIGWVQIRLGKPIQPILTIRLGVQHRVELICFKMIAAHGQSPEKSTAKRFLRDMFGQKSATKTRGILEFVRDKSHVQHGHILLISGINRPRASCNQSNTRSIQSWSIAILLLSFCFDEFLHSG